MKHKVINIAPTPQDNVLEFTVHPGISNPGRCYRDADSAKGDPQAVALFACKAVQAVFFTKNAITVTKDLTAEWSEMVDPVVDAIESVEIPESSSLKPTLHPPNASDRPRSGSVLGPLEASAFKGRPMDRSKAKQQGFKKRSIKKTETWEYCFKSGYECEHKIVIATFVQVDKEGFITNAYAEVHRVYITMMGEGKSEQLGSNLFPDDMEKAEQAIRGVLTGPAKA